MINPLPRFLLMPLLIALTGCAGMADRLSSVGEAPPMTPIENPNEQRNYQPVSMPMPAPQMTERQANSLWRSGARAFFKDQRAARVGDLLTVLITIDDKAQLANTTTRTRDNTDTMGVPNLLGLETEVSTILPGVTDPSSLVSTTSQLSNKGVGSVQRSEKINLQVAAVINQILPNGNLVMNGSQEVRVNNEVRALTISGIIRPEDITSANTITYEKVAEARISYGGRGQLSDVQQPRYGSQIMDIISPF